jgi:hypothetical protein
MLVSDELRDQDLVVSCACVFQFDSTKKGESIGLAKRYASPAVDHGLMVIFSVSGDEQTKLIQSHVRDLPNGTFRYFDQLPAYEIAEAAARHDPGPPFRSDLKVPAGLANEESFVLRRAFSDCATIDVTFLRGGKSGATVLSVAAEFPGADAGPYPLPYFAKIDKRDRIETECRSYERFVSRYVPFSQRPNFEPSRHVLSSSMGILVGDFVENSVELAAVIRPTGARGVIHSLFDDALRGWRRQAYYPGNYRSTRRVC